MVIVVRALRALLFESFAVELLALAGHPALRRRHMAARPNPDATRYDLRLLAWSCLLIELVIAGLAGIAAWFAGRQAALVIGIGFTALTLLGFLLVVGFSLAMSWLTDRPPRQ
jgi:hypothetical protein